MTAVKSRATSAAEKEKVRYATYKLLSLFIRHTLYEWFKYWDYSLGENFILISRSGFTRKGVTRPTGSWWYSILNLWRSLTTRTCISSSANLRPMHMRGPKPNGMAAKGWAVWCSGQPRNQRSGLNLCGSSKWSSSIMVRMPIALTRIPFGIW